MLRNRGGAQVQNTIEGEELAAAAGPKPGCGSAEKGQTFAFDFRSAGTKRKVRACEANYRGKQPSLQQVLGEG